MKTDLGIRIEQTLEALGMSPRAASIKAGLHPDTLSKVISGKTKSLRGDNARKVAKVLGVSTMWLLSGEEESAEFAEDDPNFGEPYGGVLEAGPFRPIELSSPAPQFVCLIGNDFPGRTGMIRIDKNKPVTTTVGGCAPAKRLISQMLKGQRITTRRYEWPYDYPQEREGSLAGLRDAMKRVGNLRKSTK